MQQREALLADLKVSAYTLQAQLAAQRLSSLYADADGSRRAEVAAMGGSASANTPAWMASQASDPLALFYQRLEDVRDYHRKHSGHASSSTSVTENSNIIAANVLSTFTDDEVYGRYVDLQQGGLFEDFCNLPGVKEARFAAFSGDEVAAEYNDLSRVDYPGYLKRLAELHSNMPARTKATRQYRRYVSAVATYLAAFFQRRYPLVDAKELCDGWLADFEGAWNAGHLPGWKAAPYDNAEQAGDGGVAGAASAASVAVDSASPGSQVDLQSFQSEQQLLESLGPEGLKTQLRLRGLKQGGSPEERASRLFSVRGLRPDQYPKKLRAAPEKAAPATAVAADSATAADAQQQPSSSGAAAAPQASPTLSSSTSGGVNAAPLAYRPVDPVAAGCARLGCSGPLSSPAAAAWCEFAVCRYADLLQDVLKETRRRVEKRQTRTYAEIVAEREAEHEEATRGAPSALAAASSEGGAGAVGVVADDDEDDDEEDKPIYNPLNLPLGWDGKPIPYWLYKLHGLNMEFPCEICGGEKYRGRRDFDRHFQEWRHAAGMRALGIPNTKHFHDITKIDDAKKREFMFAQGVCV